MQKVQEFYRCLVFDAAGRMLLKIRDILADETLNDEACFQKIEAIVSLFEEMGILPVEDMISDSRAAFGWGFQKGGLASPPLCVVVGPGRNETPWCFSSGVWGGFFSRKECAPYIISASASDIVP